ncbi:MAG: iron-containing alcohol dehydrogenase, partial [Phascolarctobacterium sp.]
MDHFQIHAPTQIIFGKNTENEAGKWCKYYGAHKVLVHFGGHSAKKSGLLDRVCASLQDAGLECVLLGGVVPNPQLSMVKKGVE